MPRCEWSRQIRPAVSARTAAATQRDGLTLGSRDEGIVYDTLIEIQRQ